MSSTIIHTQKPVNRVPATKEEILSRLFKDGFINLGELMTLARDTEIKQDPEPTVSVHNTPYWFTTP